MYISTTSKNKSTVQATVRLSLFRSGSPVQHNIYLPIWRVECQEWHLCQREDNSATELIVDRRKVFSTAATSVDDAAGVQSANLYQL